MNDRKFLEYIEFLRDNFGNLMEYWQHTGNHDPQWEQIKQDLFDEDPFVVFGASLLATVAFSDKRIYH